MAKDTKISYIKIPDQISLVVSINDNIEDINQELENNDNITCVILDSDIERSQDAIDFLKNIIGIKTNIKIAWFCYRKSIPYKAELLDYIKTEDALYMHIGDENSQRFIDISKYIETKDKLNQLDPYYFEKIKELQ